MKIKKNCNGESGEITQKNCEENRAQSEKLKENK